LIRLYIKWCCKIFAFEVEISLHLPKTLIFFYFGNVCSNGPFFMAFFLFVESEQDCNEEGHLKKVNIHWLRKKFFIFQQLETRVGVDTHCFKCVNWHFLIWQDQKGNTPSYLTTKLADQSNIQPVNSINVLSKLNWFFRYCITYNFEQRRIENREDSSYFNNSFILFLCDKLAKVERCN